MYTSNYKESGTNPNAISISRGAPRGWAGRRYWPLAPTWAMLKMNREDYTTHFQAMLDKLNPQKVADDLGPDAIMLCWEPFNVYCHRRWVAEWLEKSLGMEIPEVGHARGESLCVVDMPWTAPKKPKINPAQGILSIFL